MQDWRAAMQYLAKLKIDLRTSLPFPTNERAPHAAPLERHWLAYPVTNHATSAWSGDARLPNSLRFRLRCDFDDKSMLRALVIHVPCKPPGAFKPKDQTLVTVWSKIHKFLDQRDDLSRIPA